MTHDVAPGGTGARRRRPFPWPWILGAAALLAVYALLPAAGAPSSALSRESAGWWAARAYLEARGVEVEILDAPLDTVNEERAGGPPGVLVLALPWQRGPGLDLDTPLRRHLRDGGDILLAYDGVDGSPARSLVYDALGLGPEFDLRGDPPLGPRAWWRYQKETFVLEPAGPGGAPRLEIPAFRMAPEAPLDADVLYTLEDDASAPLIFELERHGGRVLAMPSALFTNAHLAEHGHADLLEGVVERFPGPWRFDEYHHGLVRPELLEAADTRYAWDLFVGHLVVFYLLALLALGRRFGPTWRDETLRTGSASDFLRSLGVLHHQLGHHRDAARRLLERTRRLAPHAELPSAPGDVYDPETVDDGASLARYAARLAAVRRA
ncbi:MAG: DUF4350 domain-containing protein [Acidobacteriota bacterium]